MEPQQIAPAEMEEIIIADVLEVDSDEVRETNMEFDQECRIKGIRRSFTIFNGTQLRQSVRTFRDKEPAGHRINLRYVNRTPEHKRWYDWRFLKVSGVNMLLALLFAGVWYFSRFNSEYLLVATMLFMSASMILLLVFFQRSYNRFIYSSRAAGVPLIVLDNRKPNPREFDHFMFTLEQYIHEAYKCGMTSQQLLAGELTDIRRLKDEGMLTEETYEQARDVIFRHDDYRAKR